MCERRTVYSILVLLFGVSWRWELLGIGWTFVLVIVPPVCSITPRWSYVSTTRRCCSHHQVRTMSRVWGRHAPTRSLGKLAGVWEVKSWMDRKFSRIENLWPRDGSCPLPLRSKRFISKCFRIVKTQKISREFRCSCMLIAVCSERSSYPCLCSGVVRLAHGKCEVMARYHVQTAYEGIKVRYEESRAQCGHYVLLLSSTRITLWGCAVNN